VEINGVVVNPDVDENGLVHLFEFKGGHLVDPSIAIPANEAYKDLKYNEISFVNFFKKDKNVSIRDLFIVTLQVEDCSVLDLMVCDIFGDFVAERIAEFNSELAGEKDV